MEPANDVALPPITDAQHSLLVARADLVGCTEGSDEVRELGGHHRRNRRLRGCGGLAVRSPAGRTDAAN